jgi:hypothetical protein
MTPLDATPPVPTVTLIEAVPLLLLIAGEVPNPLEIDGAVVDTTMLTAYSPTANNRLFAVKSANPESSARRTWNELVLRFRAGKLLVVPPSCSIGVVPVSVSLPAAARVSVVSADPTPADAQPRTPDA